MAKGFNKNQPKSWKSFACFSYNYLKCTNEKLFVFIFFLNARILEKLQRVFLWIHLLPEITFFRQAKNVELNKQRMQLNAFWTNLLKNQIPK